MTAAAERRAFSRLASLEGAGAEGDPSLTQPPRRINRKPVRVPWRTAHLPD